MSTFDKKTSNKAVAISIITDHLRTTQVPILTLDQAYQIVTVETQNMLRQQKKNGDLIVEKRRNRKDFFPNNFLLNKTITLSLMHDGGYVVYLRGARSQPIAKIINLIERRPSPPITSLQPQLRATVG